MQTIKQSRDGDRYTYSTADGETFFYAGEAVKHCQAGTIVFTNVFGDSTMAEYDGEHHIPACQVFLARRFGYWFGLGTVYHYRCSRY